jgi:hypothetical protein
MPGARLGEPDEAEPGRPLNAIAAPESRPAMFTLSALLVLSIASACIGGGQTPRATFHSSTATLALPTATSPSPVAKGCTVDYPIKRRIVAEKLDELPYIDTVTACTNQLESATLLTNGGEIVWTIESNPPGASVRQLDAGSLEFDSFAKISNEVWRYALLFPHSSALVSAPPTTVSWYIQGGLTASWIVHHRFAETVRDSTKEVAVDIFSRSSVGRGAVVRCAIGAYELAGTNLERLSGDDSFARLLEDLGAASQLTSCGAALGRARADHAARYGGRSAEWATRLSKMSDDIGFAARSSTLLDDAARLIHAILRFT